MVCGKVGHMYFLFWILLCTWHPPLQRMNGKGKNLELDVRKLFICYYITVCFTASTNCSTVGAGMQINYAPAIIRKALCSGRKSNTDQIKADIKPLGAPGDGPIF